VERITGTKTSQAILGSREHEAQRMAHLMLVHNGIMAYNTNAVKLWIILFVQNFTAAKLQDKVEY